MVGCSMDKVGSVDVVWAEPWSRIDANPVGAVGARPGSPWLEFLGASLPDSGAGSLQPTKVADISKAAVMRAQRDMSRTVASDE